MFSNKTLRYTHLESKTHYQYFSFRSTLHTSSPQLASLLLNKNNKEHKILRVQYILENAGQASYANAFKGYSTYYTTKSPFDNDWDRIETTYDEERGWLVWNHDVDINSGNSAYFAYFPPYSYERHLRLISKCAGLYINVTTELLLVFCLNCKASSDKIHHLSHQQNQQNAKSILSDRHYQNVKSTVSPSAPDLKHAGSSIGNTPVNQWLSFMQRV